MNRLEGGPSAAEPGQVRVERHGGAEDEGQDAGGGSEQQRVGQEQDGEQDGGERAPDADRTACPEMIDGAGREGIIPW